MNHVGLLFSFTAKDRRNKFLHSSTTSSKYSKDSPSKDFDEGRRSSDLPLFDLSVIASATDNFSESNKLGEGGFGSVYKVRSLLPSSQFT